MSTILRHMVWP